MCALNLIRGDRRASLRPMTCDTIGAAVWRARRAGFEVGRAVWLGNVAGTVIGYNIASHGLYYAAHYPLLIQTEFGLAKCRPDEVLLA